MFDTRTIYSSYGQKSFSYKRGTLWLSDHPFQSLCFKKSPHYRERDSNPQTEYSKTAIRTSAFFLPSLTLSKTVPRKAYCPHSSLPSLSSVFSFYRYRGKNSCNPFHLLLNSTVTTSTRSTHCSSNKNVHKCEINETGHDFGANDECERWERCAGIVDDVHENSTRYLWPKKRANEKSRNGEKNREENRRKKIRLDENKLKEKPWFKTLFTFESTKDRRGWHPGIVRPWNSPVDCSGLPDFFCVRATSNGYLTVCYRTFYHGCPIHFSCVWVDAEVTLSSRYCKEFEIFEIFEIFLKLPFWQSTT